MAAPAMTPAHIVDANLREAMRGYARATATGETRQYPGIEVASSGTGYSVFNSAMLTSPVSDPADLDRRLATASVHFASRTLPWSLWLSDDSLSGAAARSCRTTDPAQMRLLTQAPGMYLADLPAPRGQRFATECRRVTDARTRFDFCDVACVVFALPFRIAYQIYAEPGYWLSETRGYVGYRSGKPVAVAATVPAAGAIGVYSVGTLPQHRRCGHAGDVMRFALEDTANDTGLQASVLEATSSGYPMYRGLGYAVVTRFRVYEHIPCRPGK